ncbi:MAG: alpha/beta hydrolase [Alphaproteobacteria bacterium]|nr:alpha/beta hydrolase [Alphaproteobacteria bacterium]
MLDFLSPTEPYSAQTLRLAAEAQAGGGDVFEIARLARTLDAGDADGWEKGWRGLAEATETRARAALAAGHRHTAMKAFFAANQYWRQSDVFLTGYDNPKKAAAFRKSQELFREGAKLHAPKIEVIEVRCGAETYDGYFCHPVNPAPGKWPAVFLVGGADAFAEEIFFSGRAIIERGWAMLLVDTPGRGSSSYLKKIPTRADYEVPGMASIDWLVGRPEIDPNRIGLIGISMAGYYAPRIAAFDRRVKALVAWAGCYDLLADLYLFHQPLQATVQRLLGGVTDAEARERLKTFNLKDCAKNIVCPTLITHGTADRLMSVEGSRKLHAAIGATDKTLKIYDGANGSGGAGHCQYDIWNTSTAFMLDWMAAQI